MKPLVRRFLAVIILGCLVTACLAADKSSHPGSPSTLVITDDDAIVTNYSSFYQAGNNSQGPNLTLQSSLDLIGRGIGGGFFGTSRVAMLADSSAQCVYISNGATSNIASIDIASQQVVGSFVGFFNDKADTNGIGMVLNSNYLYAAYTTSNTIVTFVIEPGCELLRLSRTVVSGLNGGFIGGMALNGNMLVVAYGDGSIQSFNIANGTPTSNGDEQNSAGFASAFFPESVDITQDGHFAIFGDASTATTVEVSDISSGQLTPPVMYTIGTPTNAVGPGNNSASVRLSPDETLLYIGNSQGGSVTAAFFNAQTGKVSTGCYSGTLNGFYNPWAYIGSLATRDTTGTGGVLYVAEFGSSIGILEVSSNGTTCTLTESPNSPVADTSSPGLLSIQVFPPRSF